MSTTINLKTGQRRGFQNLASRLLPGTSWTRCLEVFAHVDGACETELEAAGIQKIKFDSFRTISGSCAYKEVPTQFVGHLCTWRFERSWRYWVANGYGIPPDIATKFNEQWGEEVRVDGYAGGSTPLKMCCGFAVGCYHIDTQEGLNAFAELLRSIYIEPRKESDEQRSIPATAN